MSKINTAFDTQLLKNGISELGLTLSDKQFQQLLQYVSALALWNKKFNLTAITNPKEMLIKHILDSLSLIPSIEKITKTQAIELLDVGTGAGLPGVIIAICMPNVHCTVLDSNSKKIRFIRQVISELGLTNVNPTHERIENLSKSDFDIITSRAFASLLDFVTVVQDRLGHNGLILAMKGVVPEQEIAELQAQWAISVEKLQVPFLDEQRHLITLNPQ